VTIPDFAGRPVKAASTYVISGGLGGIGREICRWMAKQDDSVHIVVLSRSKSFSTLKAAQDLMAEVEKIGASLHFLTCDVSSEESVRTAIEHCQKTLPPIRGVVQGAMVLRDCPFETMSVDQFTTVTGPKVGGSEHLVKYLPPANLDFFVMLSSVVAIIGGPSQGNYVAASLFQDQYARYLTSIGQPTTVLDLGWIQGAGYVEENKIAAEYVASQGMQPVTMDTFFRGLSYAMTKKPTTPEESQIMIGLSHTMNERLTRVGRLSFLQVRRAMSSGEVAAAGPAKTQSAQQVLQKCKDFGEATHYIQEKLLEKIASLMSISLSSLKLEGSVSDYGIDSLVAIEIRNWMRQELGCNLGAFEILGSKTIADLGGLTAQRSRWLADLDQSASGSTPDKPEEKEESKSQDGEHDSGLGSDIDTLSRSRALSYVNGENLPSLPVPTLEVTADALLKSLRLILSDEEYQKSEQVINDFVAPGGIGPDLQDRLMEHAKTTKNWHSDLWLDKQYWEARAPVFLTNYFGVHEAVAATTVAEKAATICAAVLKFQQQVEDGTMQRDLLRDAAADMEQYKNMFNACRIPGKPKDSIVRFEAASNRHIVVIRDGHFFKLSYEVSGQRIEKAQLKAALESILAMDLGPALGVAALTTLDRDAWADVSTFPSHPCKTNIM